MTLSVLVGPQTRGSLVQIQAPQQIKYEDVYLRAHDSTSDSKHFIWRYITFYNQVPPHSSLDGRTPDAVYVTQSIQVAA